MPPNEGQMKPPMPQAPMPQPQNGPAKPQNEPQGQDEVQEIPPKILIAILMNLEQRLSALEQQATPQEPM